MSLRAKQQIDRFLGHLLCTIFTGIETILHFFSGKSIHPQEIKKILVIKFWGMGSTILASSGITNLKKQFPQAKMTFLTLTRNQEILKELKLANEVIGVEVDEGLLKFALEMLKNIYFLRKEKFDLVIDLEFFTRISSLIAYLTGAPLRCGFYSWEVWRGNLHTIKVPFNRYWHTKKNFENLISCCMGRKLGNNLALAVPEISFKDEIQVKELLSPLNWSGNDNLVCINVNTGELALERRWPKEKFIELTKKLLEKYPLKIVFIGSKSEFFYVQRIIDEINHSAVINLAGKLSFRELSALLKMCRLLITNDSGPLHLAAALETPTVSFFGPETPVLYKPLGDKHIVFFKNIDCSPCINVHSGKIVKCLKNHSECMEKISVDEVIQGIEEKKYF